MTGASHFRILQRWILRSLALFCLLAPLPAASDPLFTREQGYLLQTGLSVVTIPLTDNDRVQHAAAGSAISALVTYKTGSFWKGCAAALAAGLLKEAYDDLSGSDFETRDVAYTLAGCSFTLRF